MFRLISLKLFIKFSFSNCKITSRDYVVIFKEIKRKEELKHELAFY